MTGTIDVQTAAMRRHASRVRDIAGRAEQASDAARQVAFHPQMYGLIGGALVYPALVPLEAAGVAATAGIAEALEATASSLDGLARTFDRVDSAVQDALKALEGRLP